MAEYTRRGFLQKSGLGLAGILAAGVAPYALSGCREEGSIKSSGSNNNGNKLSDFTETELGRGYEMPSGVSLKSDSQNNLNSYLTKELSSNNGMNFCSRPLYSDSGGFALPPKLHELYEDQTQNQLFEFPDSQISDFRVGFIQTVDHNGTSAYQPKALSLDSIVLDDGSILFSSNVSDKIFRIYDDGSGMSQEIWLQDNDLYGITGIEKGNDGKIYAAQVPLSGGRAGRVLSIDSSSKNMSVAAELPGKFNGSFVQGNIPVDMQNKVAENTPAGISNYGYERYALDLTNNSVFGITSAGNAELIANIARPTSVGVRDDGTLLVTTSPMYDPENNFIPTKLIGINPSTRATEEMHRFSESPGDYNTGFAKSETINGVNYRIPVNFQISMRVLEDIQELKALLSNSHKGNLMSLTAQKS